MNFTFGPSNFDQTDLSQPGCECDSCGRKTQIVQLRSKWLMVGFFPVLPLGISGIMKCKGCGASPSQSQMSAEALTYYKAQRKAALLRRNWSRWLGTGIFLAALAYLIFLLQNNFQNPR